jgi:NitT/TauT family transport system ATP-binding protein
VSELITAIDVCKSFPLPEGRGEFTVLDNVDVRVDAGEVVALLGRSGSGKSTLLRILAGLIPPSSGAVTSSGAPVHGPNADVGMVFQSFALLPWLTVIENVELGLEARGVPRTERTKRALKAIDTVGLDGFESAYPKELSGGMKQRVGFARALVVEPKVLFMDEPFSALDVLTAENLRGEIDDLWNAGTFPAKSILIVTHNIEEAVFLADRVVVLGANPGRVRGIVNVELPRPHDRNDARFKQITEYLYRVMTNPDLAVESTEPVHDHRAVSGAHATRAAFARPLPHVRVGTISGLLELIVDMGASDVARLAERLALRRTARRRGERDRGGARFRDDDDLAIEGRVPSAGARARADRCDDQQDARREGQRHDARRFFPRPPRRVLSGRRSALAVHHRDRMGPLRRALRVRRERRTPLAERRLPQMSAAPESVREG